MSSNTKVVKDKRLRMFVKAGMTDEYSDDKSFKLINLTKLLNAKEKNKSTKSMNFTHGATPNKLKTDKIELTGINTGVYTLGATNNKPEVKIDFIWMRLPSHAGTLSKPNQNAEQKRRNNRLPPARKTSIKKASVKKASVKKNSVKNSVKKNSAKN